MGGLRHIFFVSIKKRFGEKSCTRPPSAPHLSPYILQNLSYNFGKYIPTKYLLYSKPEFGNKTFC